MRIHLEVITLITTIYLPLSPCEQNHNQIKPSLHNISIRSTLADLKCNVTTRTCADTASLHNTTSEWSTFCYLDESGEAHACVEICWQSQPHYHRISCMFRYCKVWVYGLYTNMAQEHLRSDAFPVTIEIRREANKTYGFLTTCPEKQELPGWVNELSCDVTKAMCQQSGLPHTQFFNISCHKHDIGGHYGSCAEICNSDRFNHKKKCEDYCSLYLTNCMGSHAATTQRPVLTTQAKKIASKHNLPTSYSKTSKETTPKKKMIVPVTHSFGYSVVGMLVILAVVAITWWVCRKKRRSVASMQTGAAKVTGTVVGAGRKLQRQVSETASQTVSAVKEAGASFVRQISNSGNQTLERKNSLNLERRDSQSFERQNSQTMERRNSRTLERMNSIGMERRVSSSRLSSTGSGGRLSSLGSFDEEKIPLTSQLSTIDSDNDSVTFHLDN